MESEMDVSNGWEWETDAFLDHPTAFVIIWTNGGLLYFNALRPRRNGRHFPDDIFNCIFLNENVYISTKISLKFVLKGPFNNIPALV